MTKKNIIISFIGITLTLLSLYIYNIIIYSGEISCSKSGGEWGTLYASNGCSKKTTPPKTKLGRMGMEISTTIGEFWIKLDACTMASVPYEGCKCKDGTYWGSYEEGCIPINKNSLR